VRPLLLRRVRLRLRARRLRADRPDRVPAAQLLRPKAAKTNPALMLMRSTAAAEMRPIAADAEAAAVGVADAAVGAVPAIAAITMIAMIATSTAAMTTDIGTAD
jgi:hypothetical protein